MKREQLPDKYIEMKCFLLRQKALESKECLNTYHGVTAYITNNKYIAFKGLGGSNSNIVSYPISGCINIEANVKSTPMKCISATEILDLHSESLECVLIPPSLFESDP